MPQSPSPDIPVFDCVPESLVPACIPLLDCVSASVSLDPLISNCASEVLLTDSDCGSGCDELGIDLGGVSSTQQPCRFLPLDPSLVERVKELKRGKSYKNNNWAINRLNAWRKEVGLELTWIAEMKYLDLAKVLLEFFLCVCKGSGDRYPSRSIRNFHMSFNLILRDAHRVQIVQTKIAEEPFAIETNPFFLEVSSVVVAAMEKSRDAGVNLGRKKLKCLSLAKEAMILNHPAHTITHNIGVLKQILWFNTAYFLIRGNKEMYKLKFRDFLQSTDDLG